MPQSWRIGWGLRWRGGDDVAFLLSGSYGGDEGVDAFRRVAEPTVRRRLRALALHEADAKFLRSFFGRIRALALAFALALFLACTLASFVLGLVTGLFIGFLLPRGFKQSFIVIERTAGSVASTEVSGAEADVRRVDSVDSWRVT